MSFEQYLLFVFASIILCVVPGPDMFYLLGRTVAQGKKAGFAAALGINLGGYFHLTAAILGISAIIATSALAFTILKWLGAAYLIYIGLQALLSKTTLHLDGQDRSLPALKVIFWQGFISDALNPKVAIFFISLLPQFIQPESGNTFGQLLLLGFTVNIIGLATSSMTVWFAHSVTQQLRQSHSISRGMHKFMGCVFIGLGVKLANEQR